MSQPLTKSAARNIFYGGTIFFLVIFIALVAHTHTTVVRSGQPVSESVAHGKEIWERHSCINCHTILGEGAYFAPELGNVWVRYGGVEDPDGAREGLKNWIRFQPTGIPGRRQMPHFGLTEAELDDLVDFLKWTSEVDTQNWPPNDAG